MTAQFARKLADAAIAWRKSAELRRSALVTTPADHMPCAAGDRPGPYEVLTPIGAGGMGEVYQASDTRLNRVITIKTTHESSPNASSAKAMPRSWQH